MLGEGVVHWSGLLGPPGLGSAISPRDLYPSRPA